MIDRTTKLRWRRLVRRRRRQVEDLSIQAEEQLEQHFFKRLGRLVTIRRFLISWIMLFVLLSGGVIFQNAALNRHFLTVEAVPGGTYTEGILGRFTNANPLYAASAVDASVSRLVFSGLLKYDQDNKLAGDLAETWTVDERGTTYTVILREGLKWHDGKPLTAEDVVFTYQTIQKPDARSPLYSSWQGIKINAVNSRTVTFVLPSVLASFAGSLTNGIVPKHILETVPVAQLRSINFNTVAPVGSGPFRFEAVEVSGETPETRQEQIALEPNLSYHGGAPKLQHYKIRSFYNEKNMIDSFEGKELTAMSGLNRAPDEIAKDSSATEVNIPLTGQVGVFFRSSHEALKDAKVRQALVRSVNRPELIKGIGYPVLAVQGPFLSSHIGYNKDLVQLPFDVAAANKLLDEAGWVKNKDGIRTKANRPLSFRLYSQSNSEFAYVTQTLQRSWQELGVEVEVLLQSDADLQKTVNDHGYDALLYGISVGPDPDVFAYWHSSQGDIRALNRVNFSEYSSKTADTALEAGRTRLEPELRVVKYKPFLEVWRADAPALMLYQPRYLYITRGEVHGFTPEVMNTGTDRYSNVQNWMIRTAKTNK